VHFADLNLRLGLVWISVESRPGLIPQLAAEIRRRIPEAVLVGHDCGDPRPPPGLAASALPGPGRLKTRILRLGARLRGLSPPDSGTR